MKWTGIVTSGDETRCNDDGEEFGAVFIGGADIVCDLAEEESKPSTVRINGKVVAKGIISGSEGYGYSAYSPMEGDVLRVTKINEKGKKSLKLRDSFDLISAILLHEGEEITLEIVED